MAFDFSEQELIQMLDKGDEEKYWALFEPLPTWWDDETPAMSDHGYAKEMRRRRFHVLDTRVNLTENHPDARDRDETYVEQCIKRDKTLCDLNVEEGIYDWEMQPAYEAYDYHMNDPEILELEAAYARGDGSWMAYTPQHHPCSNNVMFQKLMEALHDTGRLI